MLTPAQIDARKGKLTASRIACLMVADTAKIYSLYLELTDDPAFVPEDFSMVWPVRLGEATEQLQCDWYEQKNGLMVSRRGEVVVHPEIDWAAATLDGWIDEPTGYPLEAKHCGGREPIETVIERYQPQLQWLMFVTGAKQAAITIILGANQPVVEYIERDDGYIAEMVRRATAFMECVRTRTIPVTIDEPVPAPVPGKIYDFSSNNEWGSEAFVWLENIQSKKLAERAEKSLKAMVPPDAIKCHGHSVVITRDRAGRLSLREQTL
jgi:predicted phage-related endonuclease